MANEKLVDEIRRFITDQEALERFFQSSLIKLIVSLCHTSLVLFRKTVNPSTLPRHLLNDQ